MNYTPLFLLLLGFFGVLMHNLVKMDELNRKQNGSFKLLQYLAIEKFSIALSMCVSAVAVLVSQEIKQLEQVSNWLGIAFIAIGYMAQSILVKFMGKAERIINDKSNDHESK
jgi:hypothetical protein